MGDDVWFPPGEAAMGRGEEEPAAPDATMLMGEEVLQDVKIEQFGCSCFVRFQRQIQDIIDDQNLCTHLKETRCG